MKKTKYVLFVLTGSFILALTLTFPLTLSAGEDIRLNQLGYYPKTVKRFVVVNSAAEVFEIRDAGGKAVLKRKLQDRGRWKASGETVKTGDFSPLKTVGQYRIYVEGKGLSYSFDIKPCLYGEALKASMKSYYYQRASMELLETHAGKWKRPLGHPDQKCYYHPTSGRTQGFRASPGGWYDAGDYNKYIVNAGVSVGTLLSLYEMIPSVLPDRSLNIPESGNKISDLLDELRYELDWVLTMQDDDGGVFFKCTAKKFGGFELPHRDTARRFIVGKNTASNLNFTAMAAQASRIFYNIDKPFARQCLAAARKSWQWALKNPAKFYKNPPDVQTGEYPDSDLGQEFFWAAAEMLITTGEKQFLPHVEPYFHKVENRKVAGWSMFLDELGCFSLATAGQRVPAGVKKKAVKAILRLADDLVKEIETVPYRIPARIFHWGSNGDMANDALILLYAHRLTGKSVYFDGMVESIDYLFGKNAVGYSFLTGFGGKSSLNPHHRPSGGDGIEEPVPGFLVGGPNEERQDSIEKNKAYGVKYTITEPARSYLDLTGSYASNENCINWNAPLVFVLAYLEKNSSQ